MIYWFCFAETVKQNEAANTSKFYSPNRIYCWYHTWVVFVRCTTCCHSLLLIVICCDSLSFVVSNCHSFSFVVHLVVTRCHSLYHSLSFVVSRCHSLSLVIPSLSLVFSRWTARLSFYKRSSMSIVICMRSFTLEWNLSRSA